MGVFLRLILLGRGEKSQHEKSSYLVALVLGVDLMTVLSYIAPFFLQGRDSFLLRLLSSLPSRLWVSVGRHNLIIFYGKKKIRKPSKNIVYASIVYANVTMNQWSELRGRITAFSPCSLPWTTPSPMTRTDVFFRIYFKVSSGARAFLMS